MLLTIVIPVHNGEHCIDACLNCIWRLGLDEADYEVVCVNDCSTDGTVAAVERQCKYHGNLRLVNNARNLRAGGSRNRGVREARGLYVVFMDADDYYGPPFAECVRYLKDNALDILCFDKSRHLRGEVSETPIHNFKHKDVMSGRSFMINNGFPWGPTQYLFKRSLMVDNEVYFAEECSCEDVDWAHKLPFFAKRMQFLPVVAYHYVLEPNSTTGAEFRSKERVFDRIRSGWRVQQLLHLYTEPAERKVLLGVASATSRYGIIFLCGLFTSPIEKKQIIERYVLAELNLGRLNWVKRFPGVFAWVSTLVAPVFRSIVVLNHYLKKRK